MLALLLLGWHLVDRETEEIGGIWVLFGLAFLVGLMAGGVFGAYELRRQRRKGSNSNWPAISKISLGAAAVAAGIAGLLLRGQVSVLRPLSAASRG